MIFIKFSVALAGLAAASPLAARGNPTISLASGFRLVANVTDPATDFFDPPINHWYLSGVHVGAGLNTAVLSPDRGALFFVNGTGRDVSAQATSIALPPMEATGVGAIPQGLQFSANPETHVAYIGINIGFGTTGAGILGGLRSPQPVAFAPFGGTFMVCNETQPVYTRPQYPVRFAISYIADDKGTLRTDIPADCVALKFLPECAALPTLAGVEELNIMVRDVDCYENVAGIDWNKS